MEGRCFACLSTSVAQLAFCTPFRVTSRAKEQPPPEMHLRRRSRRMLMASIMLVAFAWRALVPAGFMPSGDRPFLIEICPEDLPAGLLAHSEAPGEDSADMSGMDMGSMSHSGFVQGAHHHPGGPSHVEHCVFGTASGAGPICNLPLLSNISYSLPLRAFTFDSIAGAIRLVHLPPPRAPPGQLS